MVTKKHALAVLCLASLLCLTSLARAQSYRLLKYTLQDAPRNLLVTRGTEVQFSGEIGQPGEHAYYLQSGTQVLEASLFRERWTLHFDTAKVKGAYATLTLHAGDPNGGNALLTRLHIAIVESAPFVLRPQATGSAPVDRMQIQLAALAERKAQRVELRLDTQPLAAECDAQGVVRFDAPEGQWGKHTLSGRVFTDDEQAYELEPLSVEIVGKVRLLPFPIGDTLDLARVNGTLPLRVQTAPGVQAARVIYTIDKNLAAEAQDKPLAPCWWNPRTVPPGAHTLQVEVVDAGGKHLAAAPYAFSIVAGTPRPAPLPDKATPALPVNTSASPVPAPVTPADKCPVRLVVPAGAKDLLQPVLLSVAADAGVSVASVQYLVGEQVLPADPADAGAAFWDVRCEWPGTCVVSAVVTTQDGHTYKPAPVVVQVPVRVSLAAITGKVEVTNAVKTLPLQAVLLDGLTPVSATYDVDGKPLVVVDKAPFDAATLDVSKLESGTHTLTAHVVDTNGARYVSPALPFVVVNKPLELAKQQEERERQKAIAAIKAEIEESKHIAEYLRRKNIVGNAIGSGQRSGVIGRVYGLSVITANDVPLYGAILTVSGDVSLGSGRTNFLAFASDDARVAAETAATYCKSKIIQLGFSVDWSRMDLTVAYAENAIKNGGNSAGVADAVVLMSACLKKPVESGVAITGAIGLHGEVEPVGGIEFKATRALSDPNIHTLILPAHIVNEIDIKILFLESPELFVNKRVILASNMEEVFRQAIVGYDKRWDEAEALTLKGIRAFLDGKDTDALDCFARAQSLTPENATIGAWIGAVRSSKR